MLERRIVAIVVILVIVIGMGAIGIIQLQNFDTLQVPPPLFPPREDPDIIVSHDLEVWAEATY